MQKTDIEITVAKLLQALTKRWVLLFTVTTEQETRREIIHLIFTEKLRLEHTTEYTQRDIGRLLMTIIKIDDLLKLRNKFGAR